MKKKIILLLGLLFIIPSLNVYAIDPCTNEEMNRLKELANNFSITSERIIKEEQEDGNKYIYVYYKLTPHNMSNDLKVFSEFEDKYYYNFDINLLSLKETFKNKAVFKVMSFSKNMCTGKVLKTITIDLPDYNEYYYFHKDKCLQYPDFKYCKEEIDNTIKDYYDLSTEEIDEMFDEYIKSKEVVKEKNILTNLKDYSLVIGIVVGVILVCVIIVVIINNKKKNSDL